MNKRISKKLAKMATVREFTVQEAWDKVAHHLATEYPMFAACYFIDERNDKLVIHNSDGLMLSTTQSYDELKQMKKEVYLEPEDVTFYCEDCGDKMTAQEDIGNEGLCDDCREKQANDWMLEKKHEDYEYRNMKL